MWEKMLKRFGVVVVVAVGGCEVGKVVESHLVTRVRHIAIEHTKVAYQQNIRENWWVTK